MARLTPEDCAATRAPGRLLRRIDRLALAFVEARFPDTGLSFTHWISLKLIKDGVVTTPGDLSRELSQTTGAITRLIDALETRGLIARNRSGSDRRSIGLEITDAGRSAVHALADHVVGSWNEILSDFDDEEFRNLLNGLTKLLAALERKAVPQLEAA